MRRGLLVTGCGRSGTGYTAKLLRLSGVVVGHEKVKDDGIVTWTSVGGIREWVRINEPLMSPEDFDTVIHQVRDPLKVIRSVSIFMGKSWKYIASVCGPLDDDILIRGMQYWVRWNVEVQSFADITLGVDQPGFTEDLGEFLGVTLRPLENTKINTRGIDKYKLPELDVGMLRSADSALADDVIELASNYGYEYED